MPWRQLPDGSFFNPDTGALSGVNAQREAAGRLVNRVVNPSRSGGVLPSQPVAVLPSATGPKAVLVPARPLLAVDPFELGMGAFGETTKKVLLTGAIVGAAWAACWITKKRKAS